MRDGEEGDKGGRVEGMGGVERGKVFELAYPMLPWLPFNDGSYWCHGVFIMVTFDVFIMVTFGVFIMVTFDVFIIWCVHHGHI